MNTRDPLDQEGNNRTAVPSRPRSALVIPLLLVCFVVIYFAWRERFSAKDLAPSTDRATGRPSTTHERSPANPQTSPTARFPLARSQRPAQSSDLGELSDPIADEAARAGDAAPTNVLSESRPNPARSVAGTLSTPETRGQGQITGRVILRGQPPPEQALPFDPQTCGRPRADRPMTRFYVVNPTGGLADVFVWLSAGAEKLGGQMDAAAVLLDQMGCEYVPYVFGVQIGQKLLVRNSDPVLHNVHSVGVENRERNVAQRAGGPALEFTFDRPEILLRFKCDIHPWMFAYGGVVEHPYFAVTDAEGQFQLNRVPAGKYRLEVYHRKAGRQSYDFELKPDARAAIDFTFDAPLETVSPRRESPL